MAAITCGADAVYIGARRFGARESAGNSVQDLEKLAHYAHRYWARVYVTLNTLLYDHEFPEVLQLIRQLYEAGIDGLIFQDMGLLECDLPPLPLIASTQMHNSTPEKVAFLEQVGIRRVILARELDLERIKAIRAKTSVGLECFVHGALCVCYSGQCYMSYAIGGRSGNRGQCAQPCRKRYTLKDGNGGVLEKDRYLLSLKDMNRSDYLRGLIEAGISSFKIEGRLKDESYVKNVVSYYRQRLDAVLEETGCQRSSSGRSSIDFTPDPVKTFNRGYTSYFLDECETQIASLNTPKSFGEKIGTVDGVDKKCFTIKADSTLHNGDGICFFDNRQHLQGTMINTVQGNSVYPASMQGIVPGTVIYRNYDHAFITKLKKSRIERNIMVSLTFNEIPNGFLLSAVDEDGNCAEHTLICEKEPAKNAERAVANIKKQLTKFGATDFVCSDLKLDISEPYFLPVAQLNGLRREVIERLAAVREQQRPVMQGGVLNNAAPYPQQELSYRGNVLNQQAEAFYRRHGVKKIAPAAESGGDMQGKIVMTTRYCLRRELGMCHKNVASPKSIVEPLYLVDEHGQEYLLRFRCDVCVMEIVFGRE